MNKPEAILTDDEAGRQSSFQKLVPLYGQETGLANRLRKPADYLSNLNGRPKIKLCLPSLRGFLVVEINTIIYCEANSNYTHFHFTNRPSVCTTKSIYEYEELLADCNFIRIHRSFIINLEHIKEYIRGEGGYVILSNKHEIEVSRRKKDMLMARVKEYCKF